jgi:hypothetical protein
MKAARFLVTSAVAVLCLVSFLPGQDKYFLDLTEPGSTAPPESSGFGCGPRLGGGSEDRGPVQPIALLVLETASFDKTAYALGEEMVCQIRLRNAGAKPVPIPWSADSRYRNKDCSGAVKDPARAVLDATFGLHLVTDSGLKRVVPLVSLYGRMANPETFRLLKAGESATVKFRARLYFVEAGPTESGAGTLHLPQIFVATVTCNLDDTSLRNPYQTLKSDNEVRLTLTEAPR